MSYTSGMAIGLAIGQQLLSVFGNQKLEQNTKNQGEHILKNVDFNKLSPEYITEQIEISTVKLAASINGRRRYYVDALKNNPKLAKLLVSNLAKLPYLTSITTNVNTGSLLLQYNASEQKIDELIEFLKEKIFKVTRNVKRIAAEGLSSVELALTSMFREINSWIKKQTGNLLDLNTTLAFFFIIRGIRKVLNQGERPTGPMMLWWGYALVEGLLNRYK